MIPYQTGDLIHEKQQMERHFLVKNEFNLPHGGDCRLNDLLNLPLSKEEPVHVVLFEGDIINLKVFKTSVGSTLYTYLVCYYRDGVKVDCGYETYMSLEFCLTNKVFFEEITESIVREQRINEILGENPHQ